MSNLNQIFDLINQVRTSAENLHRDIDENDRREETKGDMESLTTGFQQLQQILSNVNQEDFNVMQREVQEWISGQQNFQEYARDVSSLVSDIRSRTKKDGRVQQKLQENLPEQHRERNIGDFFNEIKGVLEQVQNLSQTRR